MASEAGHDHDVYYVPEQSKLPILATIGLFLTVFGAGTWFNELTFASGDETGAGRLILLCGFLVFAVVLFSWFRTVVIENMQGLPNAQLKRSYVWGMSWFIFSEVMFFFAFFGALFYVRNFAGPWLAGEGDRGSSSMLWEGFEYKWPLMVTPEQAVAGEAAKFLGPDRNLSWPGFSHALAWLPLWNTIILLSSSVTVHIAHIALKNRERGKLTFWLGFTVALGLAFVVLQYMEYHEAYTEYGLTLHSGIYGTTFFMLTGFHGFHVCLGAFMLLVMWLRTLKGHFSPDDQFGFEAASWYWHFVDVVWVCLFLFVYII